MNGKEYIVKFDRVAGHDADGNIVTISVEIRRESIPRTRQTTNHKPIANPLELAITTWTKTPYGSDIGGGACVPDLVSYTMREDDYLALQRYFRDYHLNTLQAACVHQDRGAHVARDTDWDTMSDTQTAKCPQGYVYGSQWLVQPLPTFIVQYIERIAGH